MVRRVTAAALAADDGVIELPADAAAARDEVVRTDAAVLDDLPEHVRLNEDGTITLPLLHPRTLRTQRTGEAISEERYTELVFHRMTGADLRAISAASKESALGVAFQKSSRLKHALAVALFDRLDAEDAGHVLTVVGFFLGRGGKTGP